MIRTRRFRVKTATSMFMHGAENRQSAELRPPALKGVMRYWFRAVAGGVKDLEALRRVEAEVFGSTETEVGQRLVVRISPPISGNARVPLLPHKAGGAAVSRSPAIQAGQEFTVTLSAVGSSKNLSAETRLDLASWAFWLAVRLGGFGQRARRGGGSLQLLDVQPPLGGDASSPVDARSMKQILEAGLKEAVACLRRNFGQTRGVRATQPEFPVLRKENARIVVGKLATVNEQEARKKVMELRDAVDPNHNDRGFGGVRPRRLASPVHVHLEPDRTGSFAVVVTWFREPRQGNPRLVEEFLKRIKDSQGVEVAIP